MRIEIHVPLPGDPLHAYVQHFFSARSISAPSSEGAGRREVILPKGNVDFLFNLGASCGTVATGRWERWMQPGTVALEGLKTVPFSMSSSAGTHLVGVCLRAEAAAAMLPLAPGEILNTGTLDASLLPGLALLIEQV